MIANRKIAFVAVFALLVPVGAIADSPSGEPNEKAPIASQSAPRANSPLGNFKTAVDSFRQQIDDATAGIKDAIVIVDDTTKLTPESKRADVSALREKLLSLERQLGADAPFPQAVERLDSWVSAQMTRLNSQRPGFTTQADVESLLTSYRGFQEDIARAREMIASQAKSIVRTLQDLTASEALAAEYLLIGEAAKAIAALNNAMTMVSSTMDDIRTKFHELNLNASRS